MAQTVRKDDTSVAVADTDQDGEAMPLSFIDVDELTTHGVLKCDIKKLQDAGIMTADAVIMTSKRQLAKIKGISDAKVEKIFTGASKIAAKRLCFQSASDLAAQRQAEVIRITTGCRDLDNIVGGGIETMSITELYGEFRTGRVIWLDTEGTFRPERIEAIAGRFGMPAAVVLDNIQTARIHTPDHLELFLEACSALMVKEDYRLLVIDSIIAPFRQEYSGRGELSERQQRLGQVLLKLKKMASEFNIAVLLTNQVCADPGGATFVQDAKKAVGGHILAHMVDTRLMLRKGRGEQRVAKVMDSPMYPEAEATFQLTMGGVGDAED